MLISLKFNYQITFLHNCIFIYKTKLCNLNHFHAPFAITILHACFVLFSIKSMLMASIYFCLPLKHAHEDTMRS